MMKTKSRLLMAAVGMVFCLGACEEEEIRFSSEPVAEDACGQEQSEEDMPEIMVYVCGAVQTPGVMTLPENARIVDALELAGGMTAQADAEYLNLAAVLKDGEKIYVPTKEEVSLWKAEEGKSALVNINTADIDKLCTLPGIGESKAKDIVNYRETKGDFQQIEDIMKVSGIKDSLFQEIKDYITIE